jgi:hypothetical protein
MEIVDTANPEHATALAKIRAFLQCPGSCRPTGRVKEDLIRLKLSKGEVLDGALRHIDAGSAIHCQMQTMYFDTPQLGYVIFPLIVGTVALYFKVVLPPLDEAEKPYLLVLAAHESKPQVSRGV